MFNPTVQLKSGGYIVIGVTEALVAIDVNSGRSTREHSIEETALKTNLEASDEVARQLRLRDLAGLIVIDYIDMEENRNNRAVEKRLKDRLKSDRARIQVGRISGFGLMEMSRQRLRPGMLEATTAACSHCQGTGIVRSPDNVALSILREVEEEAVRRRSREIKIVAPVAIANYLMNQKRMHIAGIESSYGVNVLIEADVSLTSPDYKVEKVKGRVPPPQRRQETPKAITAENSFEEAEIIDDTAEQVVEAEPQNNNQISRDEDGNGDGGGQKKRRRGKRGGRRRRKGEPVPALDGEGDAPTPEVKSDAFGEVIDHAEGEADSNVVEDTSEPAQKPKRKRPARRKKPTEEEALSGPVEAAAAETTAPEAISEPVTEAEPSSQETSEPDPAAPEIAAESEMAVEAEPAPEPDVAPEPELASEPEVVELAPEPEPPVKKKKKRIGWWS